MLKIGVYGIIIWNGINLVQPSSVFSIFPAFFYAYAFVCLNFRGFMICCS